MDSGIYDLHADFGVDYSVQFEYTENDGSVINLGQGTLSFYVKKSLLPYDTLFEVHSNGAIVEGVLPFPSSESGYGTITVSNSVATLQITAETMDQLQPTTYFYTLVRHLNGVETMLLKGKFAVEAA
jgi:hypothetical protein